MSLNALITSHMKWTIKNLLWYYCVALWTTHMKKAASYRFAYMTYRKPRGISRISIMGFPSLSNYMNILELALISCWQNKWYWLLLYMQKLEWLHSSYVYVWRLLTLSFLSIYITNRCAKTLSMWSMLSLGGLRYDPRIFLLLDPSHSRPNLVASWPLK